jgi:hypothetical protein
MTENCENCMYFDGSKHKNDTRTQHAGICSKWCQIVFKKEHCKQFFSAENLPPKSVFIEQPKQLNLFQ